MSQTIFVPQGQTENEHFEGIGPYTRQAFRLAAPPAPSSPRPAPAPPQQTALLPAAPPNPLEALERRAYVSARWYDVGLSLIVLAAGAVGLFRLICLGQP